MTNDPQHIEDALSRLKDGQCVAMPTETVYGLACDASSDAAVEAVYQLKGRPSHNPLIVHVADKQMAQRYVEWNDIAETLANAFWPGALT
ncbi:MAG: L-threonylcarbamoyladenylate synthase, partial [Rickettsiales bacterium]|nr:L-threonylcarbamoyladenylate synthase [Rickettsiales bacterium]